MIKVFTPNKDGKIEFTKDELEKLLNEVWWDGRNTNNYWWTSPSWYPTWYSTSNTTGKPTRMDGVTTESVTVNANNIYNGATGVTVTLDGGNG